MPGTTQYEVLLDFTNEARDALRESLATVLRRVLDALPRHRTVGLRDLVLLGERWEVGVLERAEVG